MSFLAFIIVGLIAGWLAGTLVKGGGFGIVGDIVIGVLGAMIGGMIFGPYTSASNGNTGMIGSIFVATIGAILLIMLLRVVRRA